MLHGPLTGTLIDGINDVVSEIFGKVKEETQ